MVRSNLIKFIHEGLTGSIFEIRGRTTFYFLLLRVEERLWGPAFGDRAPTPSRDPLGRASPRPPIGTLDAEGGREGSGGDPPRGFSPGPSSLADERAPLSGIIRTQTVERRSGGHARAFGELLGTNGASSLFAISQSGHLRGLDSPPPRPRVTITPSPCRPVGRWRLGRALRDGDHGRLPVGPLVGPRRPQPLRRQRVEADPRPSVARGSHPTGHEGLNPGGGG